MSELILDYICDGDFMNQVGSTEHSTNPRELVTCEMMVDYAIKKGVFLHE